MMPRERTQGELMDIGAAVFHGRVESQDSEGQYSGEGHTGETFSAALTAHPYGYRSYAPLNTGLVLTYSEAGLLVLSQHNDLPSGVSEPKSGESILYNSQGCRVHLDENGDINITQKSGRFVLLGNSPSEFAAMGNLTDDAFKDIVGEHNDHTHTVTVDSVTHSGTTATPLPVVALPGSVEATEVKIK